MKYFECHEIRIYKCATEKLLLCYMNQKRWIGVFLVASFLMFGSTWITRPKTATLRIISLPETDTSITKNFVMGQYFPERDARFVIVPSLNASKSMWLQKSVIFAFQKMAFAASSEGINLKIISGTRNFWQQKAIWERKWQNNAPMFGTGIDNAKHILKYSSMPGSSRHHWGTDIDINSLEPGYFKAGRGLREITWLRKHAKGFGFCEVYSPRATGRNTGYEPEAWHWSYMPLANQYLKYYLTNVSSADFINFYGSQFAQPLKIIEHYVQGIDGQ